MKSMTSVIAGLLLAGAGMANAAQPVALSDAQMDNVSAGATAISSAGAAALGDVVSLTGGATSAFTAGNVIANAQAISGSIAVGTGLFGPVAATSGTTTTATLP